MQQDRRRASGLSADGLNHCARSVFSSPICGAGIFTSSACAAASNKPATSIAIVCPPHWFLRILLPQSLTSYWCDGQS